MQQVVSKSPQPDATPSIGRSSLAAMGLSALGIVFGDIGTSPLYTLKTVLNLTGGTPTPDIILGVLSLILWTLIIVTSVKYVTVAMSIDNDGEGGILALMALLAFRNIIGRRSSPSDCSVPTAPSLPLSRSSLLSKDSTSRPPH
jgi:KUP system potassium uptake protein